MYEGHIVVLIVLIMLLLTAYNLFKKRKKVFSYICFSIGIIFLIITGIYYLDVFVNNPTSEGYAITWSMRLLGQHEDYLTRSGPNLGLYWGLIYSAFVFVLGSLNLWGHKRMTK